MKLLLTTILFFTTLLNAQNSLSTTKTSCIHQSNYASKTLAEQKKILIEKAKQEGLEELYGTLISSSTDIKNGKLVSDKIKSRAIGSVRVKGNPKFYNGSNFGEICSDVNIYITKKDFEKYQPKKVKLHNFCYNNPSTPTNMIKTRANFKAYKQAISKFKPSLKNISDKQAESFVHGFSKSNEDFDFNKGIYCFDAEVTVLPYELELTEIVTKNNFIRVSNKPSSKHGLKVTFYEKNDFDLQHPIYTTILQRNLWLKNRKFLNKKLHSNAIYQVKIEGFIMFENDMNYLKLISDVYSSKIKIDNKLILTDRKSTKKVHLKGGQTYRLSMYIKTSNSYDISLLSKRKQSDSYITVGLKNLYQ